MLAFDDADDWDDPMLVKAGGGVVIRPGPAGMPEIVVVHRPGYDDWTLPKGKLQDESESGEKAALREVEEETGFRCRLGDPVGTTRYIDHKGRDKIARYWEMRRIAGRFRPNDEVDQLRWLTVAEALELLSYEHDRELLRQWEAALARPARSAR
ncbi:MAG TPA: NUDIX hydrolase [Candidatus Dormibacteraeota bacterium]